MSTPSDSILQRLSAELAGAVETAGAATVRVSARRRLPATGVVWTTGNGGSVVVTANHVVERDEDITVTTADGVEHPAKLIGRDPGSDLAALKVVDAHLPAATRVAEADVRVGSLVLALGRAGDLAATSGVVSAVGGPWQRGRGRRAERRVATDAPMFPGFSGGPLVDAAGSVIGVLSSHLGRGQTMAILAGDVERIVTSLGQHGRVRRGFIGVAAQPVTLPAALRADQNLAQEHGLLLVGVEPDGPAAQAGLMIGDILVGIDGRQVGGLDELREALGIESAGRSVSASILRGGQAQEVGVTVGEQSE
jgi:S1-C subfamily serine protease